VPLQLPEAAQLVALTDDQVMVVELPSATELAASVSVGAAGAVSVLDVLLPPPWPPPQAAIWTIRRMSEQHRRP
jgi:hypothetical protein